VTVSYGPRSEGIGSIKIPESASYANVRKLVQPLVAIYYDRLKMSATLEDIPTQLPGQVAPNQPPVHVSASLQDTASDHRLNGFRMVDAVGVVVNQEAEGVRVACVCVCVCVRVYGVLLIYI
jgi:hypothetical protein